MGQSNSVASLTAEEKRLVTESWAMVRKDVKKHALALFLAFFTKYPEQQKLFHAFADVPLDQLSTHPKFMAHALSVVYAASAIVSALDDDDTVEAMIAKQTINHIPRKVGLENFKNLEGIIAEYLAPHLSAEQVAAWAHAIDLFNAVVVETLN